MAEENHPWDSTHQGTLSFAVRNDGDDVFDVDQGAYVPLNANRQGRLRTIATAEGGQRHFLGAADTYIIHEGPGVLRSIWIMSLTVGHSFSFWDGEVGGTRILPQWAPAAPQFIPNIILKFNEGLTLVQAGIGTPVGVVMYDTE